MKNNLAWALRLTVLSLATFVAQAVYADSQALRDLKIHIASVQQVLVDPKLADPQKRPQRRRLAVTILHQLFDFQEMARRALGAMRADIAIGWQNLRRCSLHCWNRRTSANWRRTAMQRFNTSKRSLMVRISKWTQRRALKMEVSIASITSLHLPRLDGAPMTLWSRGSVW